MRAPATAILLLVLASPAQSDETRALLPVACAASLGVETSFAAPSWRKDAPGLAMATVEPADMQLLTRGQRRVKVRAPRLGLSLIGKGPKALLASRLYPAQIRAGNLLKAALRANAARETVGGIRALMDERAVADLVGTINREIAEFGFEVSEIDFTPASFRIWERTCRKHSE